jgi:uncharacterized membrane protein (UPF0127 family)
LGPDRVVFAATGPRARTLGLAWLRAIGPGRALLIARCRSVHTFGMRFALDLVWLDAGDEVVRVDCGVGPRRVAGCRAARSVLETRAGEGEGFARALSGQEKISCS